MSRERIVKVLMSMFVLLAVTLAYYTGGKLQPPVEKIVEKEVEQRTPSFVRVTEDDLIEDMTANYSDLSTKNKALIIKTILVEAEKYKINPLILYSILYTESSFRHWIEHTPVSITKDKKQVKIQAVGLGGIVWEWWGEKLKHAEIAETRSDLFDIEINIKAVAFVYNEFYNMPLHQSAKHKDQSALLRYFGGNFPGYFRKIDSKIAELIKPNLYRVEQ